MKYKLIKTYPGSPKINTEVVYDKCHGWVYANLIETKLECPEPHAKEWSVRLFETYSEFWEKVEEPTYKILSYWIEQSTSESIIWIKSHRNPELWTVDEPESIDWKETDLKGKYGKTLKIHSVKRLSDGEIFTVGDNYHHLIDRNMTSTIKEIRNDVLLPKGTISFNGGHTSLVNAVKVKPLFTTEDGVDILDNNTAYWSVSKWNFHVSKNYFPYSNSYSFANFCTEDAAKEYVKMNKPCVTLVELENLRNKPGAFYTNLEKFIKEKQK